jgi:replication factor C subunit 3/5
LNNIIEKDNFPNLLFYGPPGTGKTTTIINLIDKYQEKYNQKRKGLKIHLNASDDRGIDIIRNQINQFVSSAGLFNKGLKFVILDEVDYMTKNAQQALKYLLQKCSKNVRFCLICNYISRIDEALQNEFIRLRFNQLPHLDIYNFLQKISKSEAIILSKETTFSIQKLYDSDIRSMINYMQSNQDLINTNNIIETKHYIGLSKLLQDKSIEVAFKNITDLSNTYNIDKRTLLKNYFKHLMGHNNLITRSFLNFVENALHNEGCNINHYTNYCLERILFFLKKQNEAGGEDESDIV